MLEVAIAWNVYQIRHQPFDLGLVGLATFAPSLALVLLTGHVADRYDRKRLVIAMSLGELAFALALGATVVADLRNLAVVLVLVLGIGVVRAFGGALEATILINLVDERDYLQVQSRYNALRELVVIGSPALGGALVAASVPAAFGAAALMLAVAVAAFAGVRVPPRVVDPDVARFSWANAFGGVRFIAAQPIVLGAIALDLFAVLFGGATALLPVFADTVLHVGAFGFGLLRGATGIGAAAMALVLSRRPPVRRVGPTLLVAVAGFGVATLVFAFSRSLWLSVSALAVAGACDMVSVVIREGLVQLNTPDAMRGRVNAVQMVFVGASNELGAFESGTLAQCIGSVPAVAVGGAATLAVVALWALAFPALRRVDAMTP